MSSLSLILLIISSILNTLLLLVIERKRITLDRLNTLVTKFINFSLIIFALELGSYFMIHTLFPSSIESSTISVLLALYFPILINISGFIYSRVGSQGVDRFLFSGRENKHLQDHINTVTAYGLSKEYYVTTIVILLHMILLPTILLLCVMI